VLAFGPIKKGKRAALKLYARGSSINSMFPSLVVFVQLQLHQTRRQQRFGVSAYGATDNKQVGVKTIDTVHHAQQPIAHAVCGQEQCCRDRNRTGQVGPLQDGSAPPSTALSNAALLLLLPKWTLPESATSQLFIYVERPRPRHRDHL
jgi:hypothetical protein